MTIELIENITDAVPAQPAIKVMTGNDKFDMVYKDTLKIKLEGEDILNKTCPSGKKWSVSIRVEIVEEDT